MITRLSFRASKNPSNKELHCLWARLLDSFVSKESVVQWTDDQWAASGKDRVDIATLSDSEYAKWKTQVAQQLTFRLEVNSRLVAIVTNLELKPENVSLETVEFTFLRATPEAIWDYKVGQQVSLHGKIAYSVHKGKKDVCPVYTDKEELKPDLAEHFLAYLESQLGVELVAGEPEKQKFSLENLSELEHSKVWLNDVITLGITCTITDAEKFNSLNARAIGRRRAYGLGNIAVIEVIR